MSQKKNIDEYFRQGLDGFKVEPSEKVWQNIEKSFWGPVWYSKKWYLISTAALMLLLIGFTGWYFSNTEFVNRDDKTFQRQVGEYSNTTPESKSLNDFEASVDKHNPEKIYEENIETLLEEKTETSTIAHEVPIETSEMANSKSFLSVAANDASSEQGHTGSVYADITFMPGLSINLENKNKAVFINDERETLMAKFREEQKKSHFYTGLYFTPGMMYYPSTKGQFVWTAGLDFGLTYKKLYVSTGVGFQEIKEEGIYTINLRKFDSVGFYNEVQSFEINPVNPDEVFYNTEEVTVYDSVNHYTHVVPVFTYDYVNIPLNFGYKVFEKDKFTVAVEAGLTFSFMVDKQIPVVDFSKPEYTVVLIQNETPERVNFNIRWQLAVRLDMKIAKAMSVSVKPVFNKYLNSIYDTKIGDPNVKPYSMGVQFGIYYGF